MLLYKFNLIKVKTYIKSKNILIQRKEFKIYIFKAITQLLFY